MNQDMNTIKLLQTKSPIKAWYLTKFCGKKVFTVRATPIMPIVGFILYSRCWVLISA